MEKNPHIEDNKPIEYNSNGLMSSNDPNVDYTQLGDVEYEWHFKNLLDESPLFKLGFSPKNIFYQQDLKKYTNIPGMYIKDSQDLSKASAFQSGTGKIIYDDIMNRIEKNQIPKKDFVFLSSFMLPGDRTKDFVSFTNKYKDTTFNNLDEAHELSTHMHEFIHRAIAVTPELKEWMTTSGAEPYEEILMAAFTAKYFPQIAEYEADRVQRTYKVDINTKYNKKKLNKWIDEMEIIAIDNLKKQGKFYEKIVPKEKKSLVEKPKIKLKPKPPIPKKSFMQMLKSLFTGE